MTFHPNMPTLWALFSLCCAAAAPAAAAERLPATLVATAVSAQPALAEAALDVQLLAARRVASVADYAAEPGARRLHISVRENISVERVGRALTRTLSMRELRKNPQALLQLGTAFSERQRFQRGDVLVFEHLPGQALRLFINGTPAAEALGDATLMNVLARAWVEAPEATATAAPPTLTTLATLRLPAGR